MKYLITGGAGFIGSHLVETLIKKNYNIRAFVQYNSFSSIGWLEELSVENKKKIERKQKHIPYWSGLKDPQMSSPKV